jgi:hypothetical protein
VPDAPIVGVCIRDGVMAIAVLRRGAVLELRRHWLYRIRDADGRIAAAVRDYVARAVVVELPRIDSVPCAYENAEVVALSFGETKRRLLGTSRAVHADIFRHVLNACPELARFVSFLPGTTRLRLTERWRTVLLLAVALALAHDKTRNS